MSEIRVVLADDYPLMREKLRHLIDKASGITVIGEAANGFQALELVEELEPEVLVLDMDMPGLSGLEVAQQLRRKESPVQVLAISAHDDKQYILGLLETGAAGYLIKSEVTPDMITKAVRGVAQGEKEWVSSRVSARLKGQSFQAQELSNQEKEILRLVVVGKTDHEISVSLGLSEEMVRKKLEYILAKLNVVSRVKAAVYAVQEGLV